MKSDRHHDHRPPGNQTATQLPSIQLGISDSDSDTRHSSPTTTSSTFSVSAAAAAVRFLLDNDDGGDLVVAAATSSSVDVTSNLTPTISQVRGSVGKLYEKIKKFNFSPSLADFANGSHDDDDKQFV